MAERRAFPGKPFSLPMDTILLKWKIRAKMLAISVEKSYKGTQDKRRRLHYDQ
jgi:hypothetical protein